MSTRFLWIWDHDVVADADAACQEFARLVGRSAPTPAQAVAGVVGKEPATANVSEVVAA
jgi:hypothetical protein